jgi:hypothetical protein
VVIRRRAAAYAEGCALGNGTAPASSNPSSGIYVAVHGDGGDYPVRHCFLGSSRNSGNERERAFTRRRGDWELRVFAAPRDEPPFGFSRNSRKTLYYFTPVPLDETAESLLSGPRYAERSTLLGVAGAPAALTLGAE